MKISVKKLRCNCWQIYIDGKYVDHGCVMTRKDAKEIIRNKYKKELK